MSYDNNKPLEPLKALRENASAYFEKLFASHRANMACGVGCSKCCEVGGLSVHESEATLILDWFLNLSSGDRNELQRKWTEKPSNSVPTCPFLVEKCCSIYDSRPVICRTQGAPLRFKVSEDEVGVDACPLNFTEEGRFPIESEWLDLDRLNTLLSIAEQSFRKQTNYRPLAELLNKDGRVLLSSLQQFLLTVS